MELEYDRNNIKHQAEGQQLSKKSNIPEHPPPTDQPCCGFKLPLQAAFSMFILYSTPEDESGIVYSKRVPASIARIIMGSVATFEPSPFIQFLPRRLKAESLLGILRARILMRPLPEGSRTFNIHPE